MKQSVRDDAFAAARGKCRACGNPLGVMGVVHHRQAKGMGGTGKAGSLDYVPNVEVIHDLCHKWVHDHPKRARETGHIVPSWGDPSEVPVTVIVELRHRY